MSKNSQYYFLDIVSTRLNNMLAFEIRPCYTKSTKQGDPMFLKLMTQKNAITNKTEEVTINPSQITFYSENKVSFSNGLTIEFDDASMKTLEAEIFGEGSVAAPKASVHDEGLLNELNKLCGGRGEAKPTSDRKARLKARLKDFSEEELKLAAKNLGENEFMQGANESGKRYGTIDYLLRTPANVNKCLEDTPKKKKGMF